MIFDFNSRNIYLFDAIYPWTSQSVIADLLKMNKDSNQPINMIINSPGGLVTDALAIIDVMKAIESPVNTIVLGQASSCGSLISASGDKRFVSENSELMIHEAAMQGFGYIDTRDERMNKALKRLDEVNLKIAQIYAAATKKSVKEISDLLATKDDIFMNSAKSIEFGLADAILTSEQISSIKLSEGLKNINLSEKFKIEGKEELKRIHLLKACSLKDRGVEITSATLEALKANFEANIRGQDISIDYTHDNDNGEKKAGAWIKSLEIENDNLYAMVELTPTAEKMIKDKEYKYLSVEIDPFYTDNEGKMHNNVLLGGTFTNRPAVKGLDPIKLSENQPTIDMQLNKEEVTAIEAVKGMNIEIKDFHSKFTQIKAENEQLQSEKESLLKEKADLKAKEKEANEALQKIEADKIEADKLVAVEALITKGIVLNSQKEKVLNKFSSKSEIEDFYAGVPAAVNVVAKGSDVVDSNGIDEAKLRELSKNTGQSVEDIKKYGLK